MKLTLIVALVLAPSLFAGEVQLNQSELLRAPELVEFIEANPSHPLVHWAAGEVWQDKEWFPYDRIAEQGDRWNEVYRYQRERDQRESNFENELYLADGCRAHKLYKEERAHLVRLLLMDYSFHEAHLRLGHINSNDFWITPQQIQAKARSYLRTQQNLKAWAEQIQRLHRRFRDTRPGSPAEAQEIEPLFAIKTPDAIPAVERFFASKGLREVRFYQDWLNQVESYEAAEALARQAVFLPQADMRVRAAKFLQDRHLEEYVPFLLSGLSTMTTRYNLDLAPSRFEELFLGRAISKFTVVDSMDSTLSVEHRLTIVDQKAPGVVIFGPSMSIAELGPINSLLNIHIGSLAIANYGEQATELSQIVRKQRVTRTLEKATGVSNETPDEWFSWWREMNDYQLKDGKLKLNDRYAEEWFESGRRVQRVDAVRVPSSCFVKDTLVESEKGPAKIAEIRPGDCVLAQDIETGELTFKPVFATTKRASAPTMVIRTSDDETMQCSLGHPFWVHGEGWRMAKQLTTDMQLMTVGGYLVSIEQLEPGKKEDVYNLVVADHSTYFAGTSKILTHDVTPRQPTDMVVPGIRKEFK